MNPRCCGQDSEFIVQSINLKYWYCRECKNEVDPNGVKGVPVTAIAAREEMGFGGVPVSPPPGWMPVPKNWNPNGLSYPVPPPAPKAHPNTGMLRAGDTLEWRHNDGSYEMIKIQADHVKTIPSTVLTAWVNGKVIYDTTASTSLPPVPAPVKLKALHSFNNADVCVHCGITFSDWSHNGWNCTLGAKSPTPPTPSANACAHTTWVPHANPAGGMGAHCYKCGIDYDAHQAAQLTKGIP